MTLTFFLTSVKFPKNQILKALIDNGADVSCIRRSEAEQLHLSFYESELVKVANGSCLPGKWTDKTQISIFDTSLSSNLLALDNLTYQMIIVRDLLSQLTTKVVLERIFNQGHPVYIINCIMTEFKSVMCDEITGLFKTEHPEFSINTTQGLPHQ